MRIVLDTNVLVSGLLSPFGPPARILDLVLAGDLIPVFDDRILAEYGQVLARERFGFAPDDVVSLLHYIEVEGEHITAYPVSVVLPDPDDLPFLEVALTARVEALITGNVRHYPAELCQGIVILSPASFLDDWRHRSPCAISGS
jgi:putative PIN family toxin of toxin-antitoxin system